VGKLAGGTVDAAAADGATDAFGASASKDLAKVLDAATADDSHLSSDASAEAIATPHKEELKAGSKLGGDADGESAVDVPDVGKSASAPGDGAAKADGGDLPCAETAAAADDADDGSTASPCDGMETAVAGAENETGLDADASLTEVPCGAGDDCEDADGDASAAHMSSSGAASLMQDEAATADEYRALEESLARTETEIQELTKQIEDEASEPAHDAASDDDSDPDVDVDLEADSASDGDDDASASDDSSTGDDISDDVSSNESSEDDDMGKDDELEEQ
jgi:hypothetical protein